MNTRMITWRGLDDADRLDTATVQLGDAALSAVGSVTTAEYAASWRLETGPDWVTRTLHVSVQGFGWARELTLSRSDEGVWQSKARTSGRVALPAPGLAQPETLLDAVDCALERAPITHTMPARRLGLLERDAPEVELVLASVELPSLRVLRSEQAFRSVTPAGGSRTVEVRDLGAESTAPRSLSLDEDGVLITEDGVVERAERGV